MTELRMPLARATGRRVAQSCVQEQALRRHWRPDTPGRRARHPRRPAAHATTPGTWPPHERAARTEPARGGRRPWAPTSRTPRADRGAQLREAYLRHRAAADRLPAAEGWAPPAPLRGRART